VVFGLLGVVFKNHWILKSDICILKNVYSSDFFRHWTAG
jgi:hypothetical protein